MSLVFSPSHSSNQEIYSLVSDHKSSIDVETLDKRVTKIHTQCLEKNSVNETTPQEISTNTLKKKKKKNKTQKKAERAAVEALVTKQFNSDFAHPASLSIKKETVSLFSDACKDYAPELSVEEQNLLTDLLKQSAFCSDINLFEAFLIDLAVIWEAITTQVESTSDSIINKELKNEILNINKDSYIFLDIFLYYLFVYTRKESLFREIAPKYYCEKLYRSLPQTTDLLKNISSTMDQVKEKILQKEQQISSNCRPKIKQFYAEKFEKILKPLEHFHQKINLLNKCLRSREVETLFHLKKTTEWSESECLQTSDQRQLGHLSRFSLFIKNFLKIPDIVDEPIKCYIEMIECLTKNNFNKESILDCLSAQKSFTTNILDALSYANLTLSSGKSDEVNEKNLMQGAIILELYDKWLNDIILTITTHAKAVKEVVKFKTPERSVHRLVTLIEQVIVFESEKTLNDIEVKLSPEVQLLLASIEDSITDTESVLLNKFEYISFTEMHQNIKKELSRPAFSLSKLILTVNSISIATEEVIFDEFEVLLRELLNEVRTAKSKGLFGCLESCQIKNEIKNWLRERCNKLCIYTMIIAETGTLFYQPEDLFHLLPNELFNFLDLKGFDEIFSEAEITPPPSPSKVEESLPIHPLMQKLEIKEKEEEKKVSSFALSHFNLKPKKYIQTLKKETLPTKQDFNAANKKRLIDDLLQRANKVVKNKFECTRINGSHHVVSNGLANIIVPLNLECPGTRANVYRQFSAAVSLEQSAESKS